MNDAGNLFKVAIDMFLGEYVIDLVNEDEYIQFVTAAGTFGEVVTNVSGDMEIRVDDECVYVIESDLCPVLVNGNDRNLFNVYNYIKKLKVDGLQHRSRLFVDIVSKSIEKILINNNLNIVGRTIIGEQEIIYHNSKKILISLN